MHPAEGFLLGMLAAVVMAIIAQSMASTESPNDAWERRRAERIKCENLIFGSRI